MDDEIFNRLSSIFVLRIDIVVTYEFKRPSHGPKLTPKYYFYASKEISITLST